MSPLSIVTVEEVELLQLLDRRPYCATVIETVDVFVTSLVAVSSQQ